MSYFEECLKKFENLPADFKNKVGSLESFEKIEAIEDIYGIDLKFLVMLMAIGEVGLTDVPEYLQTKYQLAEEDAYEIRDRLIKEVFKLSVDLPIREGKEDNPDNVLLKSESEVIKIFYEGLVDVLKNKITNKPWGVKDLNEAIFFWLSEDGSFQDGLSKELLNNQERLTSHSLVFEDRDVSPTIASWLKDFIKINGSKMFNELELAEYLTNAHNIKNLDATEKELVRKLLKLYYNLTFFPESMDNVRVEDWKIIPFDDSVEKKQEFVDVLSKGEIVTQNDSKNWQAKESTPLAELEQTLAEYTPSSLEYKAVDQEIGRLKKKK